MRVRKPIQLLPDPLIDQIAAGEVIERPASVVKELVENSLDGGATYIEIQLNNGGLDLIQVTDNGTGISEEDLPLAIVAHATSKITCQEDLQSILTRGFRGEALASMGAVGELEIMSRTDSCESAHCIRVSAGLCSEVKPAAMAEGTRVSLHHLFRQLPARRKFLKSAKAEMTRCVDIVQKMAMTQPQVHFVIKADSRVRLDLPVCETIAERAARILKVDHLREGSSSRPGLDVKAYVAAPEHARQTRSSQYFFLLGRFIRDRAFSQVVWQSSREFVPDNRHPSLVVCIETDPSKVDVNVHPTKEEVRFEEHRRVAALIGEAIRDAMAQANYAAELELKRSVIEEVDPSKKVDMPPRVAEPQAKLPRAQRPIVENWASPEHLGAGLAEEHKKEESRNELPQRASMQLHNAYIVAETDQGLSILDQHALHERILLQKFRRQMLSGEVEQQSLLIPYLVELTTSESVVLMDIAEDLKAVGFDLQDYGDGVIAVSALPVALKTKDLEMTFQDVIEGADGLSDAEAIRLKIARICACRSAVKAGDPLKPHEIEALLKEHSEEDFSFACEHGRPTHVKISLKQLARGFERH